MTGVVLCGGESTRMGTDKGLLQRKSITWAQIAISRFETLKLPVVLSVNEVQYSLYSKTFKNSELVKDVEFLKVGGPLKGILSVHLLLPREDLVVVACDMPEMRSEIIEQLLAAKLNSDAEAFVFKSDEHIEPLAGVYTSKGLAKLNDRYNEGGLKRFSMHNILTFLNTSYLKMPDDFRHYFYNFNTPQDLRDRQL